jgi:hypothetical protein
MSILVVPDDYLMSTAFHVRIGGVPVDLPMEVAR